MKFALKASGENQSPKKIWSASSPHLPEMASGLKLQWTKKSVSSKSMRPWQWSDQKKRRTKLDIRWSENGSSASKLFKVFFQLKFPAKRSSPNHKTIWNKVKCHGYPKLPGSVSNSYGECGGKVRAYVWSVKLNVCTHAARSQPTRPKG